MCLDEFLREYEDGSLDDDGFIVVANVQSPLGECEGSQARDTHSLPRNTTQNMTGS